MFVLYASEKLILSDGILAIWIKKKNTNSYNKLHSLCGGFLSLWWCAVLFIYYFFFMYIILLSYKKEENIKCLFLAQITLFLSDNIVFFNRFCLNRFHLSNNLWTSWLHLFWFSISSIFIFGMRKWWWYL